jgi:tetratricopeptide (TPR) repeat protein
VDIVKIFRTTLQVLLAGALSALSTGCIKQILTDGQIEGTRVGSQGAQTLHDFEVARDIAYAGLGQFEGMHYLSRNNEDALYLLTRSWAGVGYGFIEDDYEIAYEKDDEVMTEYHRSRARAAYARARYFGVELLGHQAEGFQEARKNAETIRTWLHDNFDSPKQAENLLWTGYAWIAHVSVSSDIPEILSELYVGVAMVERSVQLDEKVQYATGHTILGAYHARPVSEELDESLQHFQKALAINRGEYLPTKLNLAQRYYCAHGDKAKYEQALREVVDAPDKLPEARLPNVIAKRRARRYLLHSIWQEECKF